MTEVVQRYGLSPTQQGMLFHAVKEKDSGVDIEQIVIRARESVDVELFMRAWREVMQRHALLRTRFRWQDTSDPVQEVVSHADLPLAQADWSSLSASVQDEKFAAQLSSDRYRDFDLTQAPAMRLFIAHTGAAQTLILWSFHHALLDGRSFPIVLGELFEVYDALRMGTSAELMQVRPYSLYIDWLQGIDHAASQNWWRRQLAGFRAAVPLAVDREETDTAPQGPPHSAFERHLSSNLTRRLKERAGSLGVTLNTMLQAAWSLLLHRYSGESDVVFGATRACRRSAVSGADDLVGLLINTLPVRVTLDPQAPVETWLQQLRASNMRLRDYEHTPLVKVQSWSEVARGKPLFESLVVFDTASLDARIHARHPQWRHRSFLYIGQTNFPITILGYGDEQMLVRVEYSRRRFSDAAAQRILGHLCVVLEQLADGTGRRLADLKILTPEERRQALHGWNPTRAFPSDQALHERFEAQVARSPDAIAVVYEGRQLTYAQINQRANTLAHKLIQMGVKKNQLVALRTGRNAEMVVGILGILKAGGAYLPLDPVYPRERIAFMLEDSQVAIGITERALLEDFAGTSIQTILLDEMPAADAANPLVGSSPSDLAYVIYTSGSTGKPKGVRVSHFNVARLIDATQPWYSFGPSDVWSLFHSYSFDVSVYEMWGAFTHGGRIVVVPLMVSRSPDTFRDLVINEKVTVLSQTPSAFRQFLQADLAQPPGDYALRYIIFAGEALELQSLRPWFDRYSDERPTLVNMYGITETTVHSSYRPIRIADLDAQRGSVIGVPIPDLEIYLLDPASEPTPIGVTGEIYVGGAGVTLGYLNRDEFTAQRFLPDPFSGRPGAIMYRSGDLARRTEDGDIECLGRADHQVKIRGFRIELGEIESALAQHPAVRHVTVMAREDSPGDKRLAAYLVIVGTQAVPVEQLRAFLRQTLPEYMVPAHFMFLDALPLTANGKVDRRALPAPVHVRDETQSYVAPHNATETLLADIWREVLGVAKVGVRDNFFELGGDSILTIQVISRALRTRLRLTPKMLFDYPTIAELAALAAPTAENAGSPVQDPAAGEAALMPIQHWFFEQRFAERNDWNQAFLFSVPEDLDPDVLEHALHAVMSQHDALRLRFAQGAQGWTQSYGAIVPVKVRRVDLSGESPADRRFLLSQHGRTAQTTLDIEAGRTLAAVLFAMGHGEPARLLLAIHHLVVDGVSWRPVLEDLEAAYLSLKIGVTPQLPTRTQSFQRWSTRLQEFAESSAARATLPFWRELVAAPVNALKRRTDDIETLERDVAELTMALTPDETRALIQDVPHVYRTQINDALLAALALSVRAAAGTDKLRVDLEGHGREPIFEGADVSRTVGWFTTLFPIALETQSGADAAATLKSIKEQLRRVPHRGLSYGVLRYLSTDEPTRTTLGRVPPAQILFNYLGQFEQTVAGSRLLKFAEESTGAWHGPGSRRAYEIEVLAGIRSGRLHVKWQHDPRVHDTATMQRLAEGFLHGLRDIIAACCADQAGTGTPSDFPLAGLDQTSIDALAVRYPRFEDVYPLSPLQRLFHTMESASGNAGLEQWHFRIEGNIDSTTLRHAVETVIARHTILRTAFPPSTRTQPLQVVLRTCKPPWSEEDWRNLEDTTRQEQLAQLLESDLQEPLDISAAPLMRIALRRTADNVWHMLWTTHHLYVDGWSWPLIFREVSLSYTSLTEGRTPDLPRACPYRDFIDWLENRAPRSETFWRERLAGVQTPTPFNLEAAPGRDASPASAIDEVFTRLPEEISSSLAALARNRQVTLNTVVQAAWSLLLAHYSGEREVIFGAAFSGRTPEVPGIESMVGPCVGNLPVRVPVNGDASLEQLLTTLHRTQFELGQYQHTPLEQIQKCSSVPWRYRLFDSLIVFQNYRIDDAARRFGVDGRLELLAAPEATNYPLTIAVTPASQLTLRLLYQPQKLQRKAIERMSADLELLLRQFSATPGATVAQLLQALAPDTRGRAAAIRSESTASKAGTAQAAPTNELEETIAGVWQELFGVSQISLDDNFFDLGGQSLLLLQAHVRLRERLKRDIGIISLLQFPTIRSLAKSLSGSGDTTTLQSDAAARAARQRAAMQRPRPGKPK